MNKLIITGGAGFVGSNLAIRFKKDNPDLEIICLDNLKRRGSELNLPRLKDNGIQFFHGDIMNPEDLAALGSFDTMIDCAAEPSVMAGLDSPKYLIDINLLGTINCLEAARKNNAKFLFLSTSRVYPIGKINEIELEETNTRFVPKKQQTIPGISKKGISEDFSLEGPRSLYGAAKLCSELMIQEYGDSFSLPFIINRCGVISGPWQMGKVDQGVIVFWVAKHIYGGNLSYIGYNGKGKQVRDVLHVNDVYQLLKTQLTDFNKHRGKTYNVGGGLENALSICELTDICQRITGNKIAINSIGENRKGDIPYFVTDSSRIMAATGWKPQKNVETIVREVYDWITLNKEELRPILS